MIGSLSISCCNLCTSLIWTTWDTPVKYILITRLPKAFPVFSPFKFSSCWSYSAYPLLMVLLLALSTFSCVHYFLSLSKYISPLPITPFTHPCFFCCPISFCSVSMVSSENFFYLTRIISFPGCISMSLALDPGFSYPWTSPPALRSTPTTFTYFLLPGFSIASLCRFTTSARVLSRRFLLTYVFYLSLLPHILAFLWLRWEHEHLILDPPVCLLTDNCPFWLARGFELLML